MDSFRIVVTNPDSALFRDWQIWLHRFASLILKDLNRGFDLWPELPKIQPFFMNPMNPHKSSRIFTTQTYFKQARICMNPRLWICESILFSKDSLNGFVLSHVVQMIHFVDSIRPTVFKRFVSWICFGKIKFKNNSICIAGINSEGFVYESRKLTQNL